jgi:hypothetical protein
MNLAMPAIYGLIAAVACRHADALQRFAHAQTGDQHGAALHPRGEPVCRRQRGQSGGLVKVHELRADQCQTEKPPSISASYLTASRLELADWVRGYEPSLAELYLGALRMLHDASMPGGVVLISHVVREICNRLPGRVSGEESGGRLDYTERVEIIAKARVGSALPLDGAVPIPPGAAASLVPEQPVDVPIPSHVFVTPGRDR